MKYCSTFDSTSKGNIGPVTEALLEFLGSGQTILCPAFPENGRTQYLGHLFVEDKLLSESGMRDHPLTPMRDPNLLRVLSAQTSKNVGLVAYPVVEAGEQRIREEMGKLARRKQSLILTDALDDRHMASIAYACDEFPLITGGAAIGGFMVDAWRRCSLLSPEFHHAPFPLAAGDTIVFSGSCSPATQRQVQSYSVTHPAKQIDLLDSTTNLEAIADWAIEHRREAPLLYTTVNVEQLRNVQQRLGQQAAALRAEELLSELAGLLVKSGFRQVIVAGGETAGAIVCKLGIQAIRIGGEISPGVPWTETLGGTTLSLALKSGNFGGEHFFEDAQKLLRRA